MCTYIFGGKRTRSAVKANKIEGTGKNPFFFALCSPSHRGPLKQANRHNANRCSALFAAPPMMLNRQSERACNCNSNRHQLLPPPPSFPRSPSLSLPLAHNAVALSRKVFVASKRISATPFWSAQLVLPRPSTLSSAPHNAAQEGEEGKEGQG